MMRFPRLSHIAILIVFVVSVVHADDYEIISESAWKSILADLGPLEKVGNEELGPKCGELMTESTQLKNMGMGTIWTRYALAGLVVCERISPGYGEFHQAIQSNKAAQISSGLTEDTFRASSVNLARVLGDKSVPPSTGPERTDAQSIEIVVEEDEFKGVETHTSPVIEVKRVSELDIGVRAVLYAQGKDDSYDFRLQTLIRYVALDWHRYDHAYLAGGVRVEATQLPSDVDCSYYSTGLCDYSETLDFDLSRELLDEKRTSGAKIKIYSVKGSDVIVEIPKEHISALLDSVDQK